MVHTPQAQQDLLVLPRVRILGNRIVVGDIHCNPILLAAAVAHLGHVAADHFHNGISPWGYSLIYRALVRFETTQIVPDQNVLNSYRAWPRMLPFRRRLKPWYQRQIEPWFQSSISD